MKRGPYIFAAVLLTPLWFMVFAKVLTDGIDIGFIIGLIGVIVITWKVVYSFLVARANAKDSAGSYGPNPSPAAGRQTNGNRFCPSCGAVNGPDAKFCIGCGEPLE